MTARRRLMINWIFTVLAAFAPSGTRYIWRMGLIDGQPVEPGTVSLFGMQIVAVAFAAAVFVSVGRADIVRMARRPSGWLSALLAGLGLLSVLQWPDKTAGLVSAGFLVISVAVFWAIVLFRPDPHQTLVSFVGGAVFQVAIGGWQFLTQYAPAFKWLGMAPHSASELGTFVVETGAGRWLRAYGALAHPNIYGLYVAIGLLACVGLAAYYGVPSPHKPALARLREPGHGRHLRYYAFLPVITAGLVFALSRSAFLAAVVGLVWLAVSASSRRAALTFKPVITPSVIIIAVSFAAMSWIFAEPLLTRAGAVGRLEVQSISERVSLYDDAAALEARHPILGVGIGRMPLAARQEINDGRGWWLYDYVHSVPDLIRVEIGWPGFICWLVFIFLTLSLMMRRLSRLPAAPGDREGRGASSGVTVYGACFAALLISSLLDHFLWSSWFGQLLFWMIAGLLYAAYHNIAEKQLE